MKIYPGFQSGIYFLVEFLVFAILISSQLGQRSVYFVRQLVHTFPTILYVQVIIIKIHSHWKTPIVFLLYSPMILGNELLASAPFNFLAPYCQGLLKRVHDRHFPSHACHQIIITLILVLVKQFPSFLDELFIDFPKVFILFNFFI